MPFECILDTMKTTKAVELAKWAIRVDRRLVTLRYFKHNQFAGAAEIAKETDRSTQNVSTALKELEDHGLVKKLEAGRKSWKKYSLSELGESVLQSMEKELSTGLFERLADEMSFRYVRDAYRLVVTEPVVVTKDMILHDVIDRIIEEPRTRSAYVVDGRQKLLGMIGLKQMMTAVEGSLTIFDGGKGARAAKRSAPLPFSVEKYMFKPITVTPDDRLISALKKMIEHDLEDLPVVDENGYLIGELNGFEVLLLGTEIMRNQERE